MTLLVVFCMCPLPVQSADAVQRMDYGQLMQYILDAEGRVVLVNFWATWCGPCLKEMPYLKKMREDVPEDELAMAGVSLDFDPKAVQKYLEKNPLNFDVFIASADIMDLMEVQSIPATMLYDAKGMQVFEHKGFFPPEELRKEVHKLLEE